MNLKSLAPLFFLVLLMTSCHHRGDMHMVVNNGSDYHMDIVRGGRVEFTSDSTAIKSMTSNGYLSFTLNNKRLRAEYDEKEGVYMEIYENDKLLPAGEGKAFLAEAVKEMAKRKVGNVSQ